MVDVRQLNRKLSADLEEYASDVSDTKKLVRTISNDIKHGATEVSVTKLTSFGPEGAGRNPGNEGDAPGACSGFRVISLPRGAVAS